MPEQIRVELSIAAATAGILSMLYGVVTFLKNQGIDGTPLSGVALLGGIGILMVVYLKARLSH